MFPVEGTGSNDIIAVEKAFNIKIPGLFRGSIDIDRIRRIPGDIRPVALAVKDVIGAYMTEDHLVFPAGQGQIMDPQGIDLKGPGPVVFCLIDGRIPGTVDDHMGLIAFQGLENVFSPGDIQVVNRKGDDLML
jgi:hypothetical protein